MVHLLEHLRFGLRCLSFSVLKFTSYLKLIQSVERVGILGICVTNSFLRVLLSGFWVSGSQVPSFRDPVPGSWVSGSRVAGSPVQGSQSPRSQGLGSRVSGPDFRLCHEILMFYNWDIMVFYPFSFSWFLWGFFC